jgi:nicotinate-nucleotide adenylyltransferase
MSLLGVLTGVFDPVHNAHLQLAAAALEQLQLDEVRWIPAGIPAHRSAPAANAADRLEMVRLAISGIPRFRLDDRDAMSAEPSHFVKTLQRLRDEVLPDTHLVLILGADQLLRLDREKDWLQLFELAHVGVAQRPGYSLDTATMSAMLRAAISRKIGTPDMAREERSGRIVHFPMRQSKLAAAVVRERILNRESAAELLPPAVAAHIETRKLYAGKTPQG